MDLAIYTTLYPAVEPYVAEWYRSLCAQTDRDFRLWIGLDLMSAEAVTEAIGAVPDAVWVAGREGDTPATIRQRAFERIVDQHNAVGMDALLLAA